MAGISKKSYKLKNGKTVVKYTITYRDIYGRQHTSGSYDTERAAAKDLKNFEGRESSDKEKITFGDIINLYLEKVDKKYADSTKDDIHRYVDAYLKKYFEIKYKKLDSTEFQKLFDEVEIVAPFAAYNLLKLCKAAVNTSIKKRKVNYNIFKEIEPIKLPKSKKTHLTLKEALNVLEECTIFCSRFFPTLFTLIMNGLREGEAFALEKSDFDFVKHTLRVNKQFTKGKFKLKTKTDSSNRIVYMFPIYSLFMEIYLESVPDSTNLALPNKIGGYQHASNLIRREWHPLLEHCGIDKTYTTLHKLRGFYIDLLFLIGAPGKFAQAQAGHADYGTTYNSYAKNGADIVDCARKKMYNAFGIEFGESDNLLSPEEICAAFSRILIKYVENNEQITEKINAKNKINEFFEKYGIKKCEQNVSNDPPPKTSKIILFPKPIKKVN